MGKFVLKDARVEVNAINLSAFVQSVTMNVNPEIQDASTMGTTSRIRLAGLLDWSVDVTFTQNFDSASVDATLFAIINGGVAVDIKVRPTTGVVSPTNPEYSGNVMLSTYQPVGNAIGETATINASFQSSGDLTRATA